MKRKLEIISFDADDTLWENETFFRENEQRFCHLLKNYTDPETTLSVLLRNEIKTLPQYGYGIKGFTLSMIETALEISKNKVEGDIIEKILNIGKEQMASPVKLIEGVEETLSSLQFRYTLVMATKGDLTDQERKIEASGLKKYFSHIEIMSEKDKQGYQRLINRLNIHPESFMMVGNSLKSDILPVLSLGGYATHIPFYTTWEHEVVNEKVENERLISLSSMRELLSVV